MAERYQRAYPGKPLSIPAATWNDLLDMQKWWKLQTMHTGPGMTAGKDRATVRIQNTSASDMDERFGVIGIEGVLYGPSDNELEFLNNFTLTGTTPTTADHAGKFAILQQPLRAGKLGRAIVAGVTPCKVNIVDEGHEYADVADGDATQLESAPSGTAKILWKPEGVTGTHECLVQLGTAVEQPFLARIVQTGPNGEADYGKNDRRYWARPVRIANTGSQTTDSALSGFVDIGDATKTFTLVNTSELRANLGGYQNVIGPHHHLWPNTIVPVRREYDAQGVVRYVTSTHPYEAVFLTGIAPDTGSFAGKRGFYQASLLQPANNSTALPVPVGSGPVGGDLYAATGSPTYAALVINGPEILTGGNYGPIKNPTSHILGVRWGWTAETPPRVLVMVNERVARTPSPSTVGTTLSDLQSHVTSLTNNLRAAGLLE